MSGWMSKTLAPMIPSSTPPLYIHLHPAYCQISCLPCWSHQVTPALTCPWISSGEQDFHIIYRCDTHGQQNHYGPYCRCTPSEIDINMPPQLPDGTLLLILVDRSILWPQQCIPAKHPIASNTIPPNTSEAIPPDYIPVAGLLLACQMLPLLCWPICRQGHSMLSLLVRGPEYLMTGKYRPFFIDNRPLF